MAAGGRNGRRPGATSWWRNPTALAGHHLNVLIEMWLSGAPIQVGPDRWLVEPSERRHTVPPKVMRVLAEFAIGQMMQVNVEASEQGRRPIKRPDVDAVLAWARRRAPSITLRRAARLTPLDERDAAYQEYLDHLPGKSEWPF